MGTKVQYKSTLPEYSPMRDLNNDSNSRSWHVFYGERAFSNAQYHNMFLPKASANGYVGDDKDVVKQKMLEHEAIFKNQVFELHRLYRIQRDLMDKFKSKVRCRNPFPVDSLFSSSPLASQVTFEDASRRNLPGFPVADSSSSRLSTSVAEEGHSSLNSVKGNGQKPCFFPPQFGNTTKEPRVLESRPTKIRRKMLDLQLPAEEYVDSDDEEGFHDENGPNSLNHYEIKNQKAEHKNDVKLYADDGEKTNKFGACLANRSCLADLNEPVQLVEANTSTIVDPPISASLNTNYGRDTATENGLRVDNDIRSGGMSPHFLESGPSSYKEFSSMGLQTKMWPVSSQPMQNLHSEIQKSPPFYPTDQIKSEQRKEGSVCRLQFVTVSSQPDSSVPSHISFPHPSAPDFVKSLPHSKSSWDSANSSVQKPKSAETPQCLNSTATQHKNLPLPFRGIENSGERRHLASDSRDHKDIDIEIPYHNGSFLESSSEYKEKGNNLSSVSYNYWKCCNNESKGDLDNLNHCEPLKLVENANSMDMKHSNEKNFNMVVANGFSSEAEQKIEENCVLLPWLKGAFAEAEHDPKKMSSSLNRLSGCFVSLTEVEDNKKDRVVDINLPCDPAVTESDNQVAANNLVREEQRETKVSTSGYLIDLNLCLSDNDDGSLRSTPRTTVKTRGEIDLEAPAISETDEIVEVQQNSASKPESKAASQQDELMASAAEAIVSISSSVSHIYLEDATCSEAQDSLENPLNWLAEIVFSCGNDFQSEPRAALRARTCGDKEESSRKGTDWFESTTLGLTETNEEEYMPKPLIPEHITVEEKAITLLQSRLRKGPAKRGRQKRDFQRDILPGLTSLSRHEVSEDLNAFGGLMQATGHYWNLGSAKTNSSRKGGRGRRRSVIGPSPDSTVNLPLMNRLSKPETRAEDRSLTGWGKTTRRPRRQRVPAGNLASIPLV